MSKNNQQNQTTDVTLKVKVERVFYKSENENSSFGIYSVSPVEKKPDLQHIKLNKRFKNFTVKGESMPLEVDKIYTINVGEAEPDPTGRYDDSYILNSVEPPALESIEDQQAFLEIVLTEQQFENTMKVFPNHPILDMFENGEIKGGDIKGIGDKTVETIKNKIKENKQVSYLLVMLQEYGFSTNRLNSIMKHFKNPDIAIARIKENIYNLCNVKGMGFLTVDEVVQKNNIHHTSNQRRLAALEQVFNAQLNEGHTWTHARELLVEAMKLTNDSQTELAKLLNNSRFKRFDDGRVALDSVYQTELSIKQELERINSNANTIATFHLEQQIEAAEIKQGFKFTDEQRQAIYNAHTCGVSILTGGAGTGKSATVLGIASTTPEYKYVALALSGTAVDVLNTRGITSATIHRGLGLGKGTDSKKVLEGITNKSREVEKPTVTCVHTGNKKNSLEQDLYILDEYSMVNIDIYLSLLKSIPNGARLVLVGDHSQLPPIGYGDVARDLMETKAYPITYLTKIHRQAQESGIITLSHEVDKGNQVTPRYFQESMKRFTYGQNKDAHMYAFNEKDDIPQFLVNLLKSYKERKLTGDPKEFLDIQVIAPMRSRGGMSVNNINKMMQDLLNPEKPNSITAKIGSRMFREGDKVMISGNTYDVPLLDKETGKQKDMTTVFNGSIGIIKQNLVQRKKDKDIYSSVVEFQGLDGYVVLEGKDYESLDLSYASTVHKLQGSSAKVVIFVMDYSSYVMLSKQLLYVAVTRAEELFIGLVENSALHRAIETNASSRRRTFLRDLLKGDVDID